MPTTQTPNIHWASVDQRFLQKVDRVFDASPLTVFNELLQNARRAEATEVVVRLEEDHEDIAVYFSDNGTGLDSPAMLLLLAGRGWNDDVESAEDPAGMGFFCLSNFNSVKVYSRDWTAVFTPEVFRGEKGTEQLQVDIPIRGFTVEFRWESKSIHAVKSALRAAAEFCGLASVTVLHVGEEPEVILPKDFLHDNELPEREIPELGVRIGACRDKFGGYSYSARAMLNFRGVNIALSALGPHMEMLRPLKLLVKVDVLHTRAIQLVLPARNAVKHTAGRDALLEEIERTAYEWVIAQQTKDPDERYSFPYASYQRAKERFDLDIGEAKFGLQPYEAEWNDPESSRVRVDRSIGDWEFLRRLLRDYRLSCSEPGDRINAYLADPAMSGYSWYDSMPALTKAVVKVDGAEIPQVKLLDPRDDDSKGIHEFVEHLEVDLQFSDKRSVLLHPPVLILGDSTYSDWGSVDCEVRILMLSSVRTAPDAITTAADALTDALFEPYTEGSESVEDQEKYFRRDATAWLFEQCNLSKQAHRHCMKVAMGNVDYSVRDQALAWTLRFDGRDGDGLRLDSFQLVSEEADNHKLVSFHKDSSGKSGVTELVSETPVTLDRVRAYLAKVHGIYEFNDRWFMDTVKPTVDLDAWEKSQTPSNEPAN